jgi:putative effector of murein hydrolase LrgA (UPF0299 family)
MIAAFTLLLLCQLAGEVLVHLLHMPVPGPLIGMVLLFVGLVVRGRVADALEGVARTILGNLALLFVPASVGVMVHLKAIAAEALPIAAAVIGSTVMTIAVTGLLMQRLGARTNHGVATLERETER